MSARTRGEIPRQSDMPCQDDHFLSSSALVGGATGTLGATFGAGYATLKNKPFMLWTVGSGIQCFVLGSTFWLTRSILRKSASDRQLPSRTQDLMWSTMAGTATGLLGGSMRGRGNILPGALVFSMLGLSGELVFPTLFTMAETPTERRPLLQRLSDSTWWPLKSLSDADYEKELREKVLALDAQVAMIDERIATLKTEFAKAANQK